MSVDLKPCPAGHDKVRMETYSHDPLNPGQWYQVECFERGGCSWKSGKWQTPEQAAAAWNERGQERGTCGECKHMKNYLGCLLGVHIPYSFFETKGDFLGWYCASFEPRDIEAAEDARERI